MGDDKSGDGSRTGRPSTGKKGLEGFGNEALKSDDPDVEGHGGGKGPPKGLEGFGNELLKDDDPDVEAHGGKGPPKGLEGFGGESL